MQPEGLRESSRWSQRSEDHRVEAGKKDRTPTGCQMKKGMQDMLFEILAPLRGAKSFLICSGGFRFASTTGYYLPAFRADPTSKYLLTSKLNWRLLTFDRRL